MELEWKVIEDQYRNKMNKTRLYKELSKLRAFFNKTYCKTQTYVLQYYHTKEKHFGSGRSGVHLDERQEFVGRDSKIELIIERICRIDDDWIINQIYRYIMNITKED